MQKKLIYKTDITRKLILFSIIPTFLLAVFFIFVVVDAQEKSLQETHIKLLKNIDYKVNSFSSELFEIEKIIAETKGKDKNIYNNIFKFRKYISSIVLIDNDGKIKKIFSNEKVPFDKTFDYAKVLDLKTFLETKNSVLGDVYVIEDTNESYVPYLFEYNGTIYILNIKLEYFNDYLKALLGEDKSTLVCIVDKKGTYIVNSLSPEANKEKKNFYKTATGKITLLGKEYELLQFSEKNQTQRVTYTIQKDTNWKLVVKDGFDKVYEFIQNILLIVGTFIILLLIFVVITAKKVAKNIVEPVESLILEIQDFANETEHLDTTNSTESRYYIFNILIDSFEKMKDDIIDREIEFKNLSEHLEEKTTQLETMNQTLKIRLQSEK
jgi:predicted PurR-regulated permease PerM